MRFDTLCIIGCGDIGSRVARLAMEEGTRVVALSRNMSKCAGLKDSAVQMLQGDLDDPASLLEIDLNGAALLYAAPPPGGGIEDSRVKNFLAAIDKGNCPARIVYIGTTSVYGDCGCETVTEERPLHPANHTARRRADAEERFRNWGKEHGVDVIILRVAGIYGPGRIPMDRITNRHPLLDNAEAGQSNRIHAEDLATVCMKAIDMAADGEIFNVCDGEAGTLTDYFNTITDLLGLPRLPQVPLSEARSVMTPLMFGYMSESRRISNRKMIEKLGITLKYPTMREGLRNALNL